MWDFIKKYIVACAMLFIFCFILVPRVGHGSDVRFWENWATHIFENGLGDIYNSNTDYLPLFHYILKVFGDFQGSTEDIHNNIHYLKIITLLFDFVIGFFIALLIKKEEISWDTVLLNILLFYFLNMAILYDSIIWNQVDSILTCFAFISCYFAYKKRITLSLVFLVLAVNFKLQAIIFVPLVGLLLLPVAISTFSVKKLVQWTLIPAIIQFLILLPFIISNTFDKLLDVVFKSVDKYPLISLNAYNIWDILLPGQNLIDMNDNDVFIGTTYKTWGLLLFCIASATALFPLLKEGYRAITRKTEFTISLEKFLISAALIPLVFFFFNTQMHERYSHPAFAFLITYAIYKKKPFVALIGCVAYVLNLETVFGYMNLVGYRDTLLFNRTFIASLFLLTIILLYADLYNLKFRKKIKNEALTV